MRTWFWTLLLACVAVAVAVILRAHPGNVLIMVAPWRIELSLTLAVSLLVALFVALYVGLRLLAWLVAIPDRVRAWRGRRAQARDHELLERGWISLLEGRYSHAEKDMVKLLDQTRVRNRRVLAALSAARAKHGLGEFDRRDQMLDSARAAAGDDAGLQEATATLAADMLLDQGQPARALEVLAPLQDGGVRHLHTMRLQLRAETALGHHDKVFTLARGLLRRNALDKAEGEQLIDRAAAARLRAGMADDQWRAVWKDLKADERVLPHVALAAAAAFEAAGEDNEAARVLESAIAAKFNPVLVSAYARCEPAQVARRLAKAEIWAQQRPADAEMLTALGLLCLNGQLWGQAERYLQRSAARQNDPQTHALLGSLYDRLNRPADAAKHWRLATAARIALPILALDAALPAADTQADPRGLDAEGAFADGDEPAVYAAMAGESAAADAALAEVPAPSAVDYVLDPDARSPGLDAAPPPAADVPLRSAVDIEEYFDSAPIPVEVYETPASGYATSSSDESDDAKAGQTSPARGKV